MRRFNIDSLSAMPIFQQSFDWRIYGEQVNTFFILVIIYFYLSTLYIYETTVVVIILLFST